MANFLTSSIGKKFIQSVSGAFLIIFLLLHGTINFFSVIDSLNGNFGKVAADNMPYTHGDGWFQLGCDFMSSPVIDIMVPIEKLKQQTSTVKIAVRNAPPGVKMLLFPGDVEVSYRSPVSRIKDDAGITTVVDYNSVDFNSPSNKVKVIIGEMPAVYQDVKLSHDSVEYIIEKSR